MVEFTGEKHPLLGLPMLGGGGLGLGTAGAAWVCAWGGADPWVSFSRPLMGGLAAGVQDAVSRNWVPSALSDSLVCLIPGLLPPPSRGVFPLILWERERGIFFLFFF